MMRYNSFGTQNDTFRFKNEESAYKKKGRCNFEEKIFPLVCSKYLSSWTGPDRSRQVQTGPDMPPGLALAGPDMSE